MASIIAFANQKGGVGKTTSAINIASAMARKGKKTLLLDLDPQGNATSGVGINKKAAKYTVYDVLLGVVKAEDAVLQTKYKNLSVMPANIDLAGAELELPKLPASEGALKRALAPLADQYRYIVIDCPPSLSRLTVNALVAANGVVIPMQSEYYALEGLAQLSMTIRQVRQLYNPTLELSAILLTMHTPRFILSGQVVHEIKKYYADKLLKTTISRSVKLCEAPSHGKPIDDYEPHGKSAFEYGEAARELMFRI